jgi:hypothetical protein
MPYEGGMGSHLLLLGVLLLLNTINFWDRNLLFSLAATSTPGCEQVGDCPLPFGVLQDIVFVDGTRRHGHTT